jgi:VWFA-related protein
MPKRTLALAAFLLLTGAFAAQIRVDVQLVNVVATVTDNRGRYVPDLKISDFVLMEDGSPMQISHFAYSNDLPVSVGIVLDTSGSMERKIGTATRAVDRFLRDIHEDDDIFLMTFDDVVRVRQDFTSDRGKLRNALDQIGPASLGNGTSLYDAVIAGVEKLRKGKHPKKAILLISDGVDTTSSHNFNAARIAVRESEGLLYALGIAPDGISSSNPSRIPGTTIPGTFPPTSIPGIPGQRPPTTSPYPAQEARLPCQGLAADNSPGRQPREEPTPST